MSVGGSLDEAFERGFRVRVDRVYELGIVDDHREAHGWVTGCLGDVFAPVWFVAENPSLKQVERIADADRSSELQWTMTPGDRLFRQALFDNGFKAGDSADAPGGWCCYITDVVKSAAMVGDWNERRSAARSAAAEAWAPVLEWELQCGRPRIVVTVGRRARQMLHGLIEKGLLPDPAGWGALGCEIPHYVSVTARPDNARRLPPNDPTRRSEFLQRFADLAAMRDALPYNLRIQDGRERFLGTYRDLRVTEDALQQQFAFGSGMGQFSGLSDWRPLAASAQPVAVELLPSLAREASELLALTGRALAPGSRRVLSRLVQIGIMAT